MFAIVPISWIAEFKLDYHNFKRSICPQFWIDLTIFFVLVPVSSLITVMLYSKKKKIKMPKATFCKKFKNLQQDIFTYYTGNYYSSIIITTLYIFIKNRLAIFSFAIFFLVLFLKFFHKSNSGFLVTYFVIFFR